MCLRKSRAPFLLGRSQVADADGMKYARLLDHSHSLTKVDGTPAKSASRACQVPLLGVVYQFDIFSPLRIPQLGQRKRMGVIKPNLLRRTFR